MDVVIVPDIQVDHINLDPGLPQYVGETRIEHRLLHL